MRIGVFAVMVAGLASPAIGQEMPRFDVEAHCTSVKEFAGGSEVLYNSCVGQEQRFYDGLKGRWAEVPEATRRHCIDVAEFGGGSYMMLSSCVDQELEAAGSTPTFKY